MPDRRQHQRQHYSLMRDRVVAKAKKGTAELATIVGLVARGPVLWMGGGGANGEGTRKRFRSSSGEGRARKVVGSCCATSTVSTSWTRTRLARGWRYASGVDQEEEELPCGVRMLYHAARLIRLAPLLLHLRGSSRALRLEGLLNFVFLRVLLSTFLHAPRNALLT